MQKPRHTFVYDRNRPKTDQKSDRLLLDVKAVGKRLNISMRQVYKLIDAGDLSVVRMGEKRGIRLRESDVEKFVEKRVVSFE